MSEFFQGGYFFRWDNRHLLYVRTRQSSWQDTLPVGDLRRPKAELDDVHEAIEQYISKFGRSPI